MIYDASRFGFFQLLRLLESRGDDFTVPHLLRRLLRERVAIAKLFRAIIRCVEQNFEGPLLTLRRAEDDISSLCIEEPMEEPSSAIASSAPPSAELSVAFGISPGTVSQITHRSPHLLLTQALGLLWFR